MLNAASKGGRKFWILSVKTAGHSSQGCSAWHILRLLAISSFLQAIHPAIGDKVQERVPLQGIILLRYDDIRISIGISLNMGDMDCRL
jgi:hypothetical protein